MIAPHRVAIVHFHLRPGGVTTVIERAVAALAPRDIKTIVLCDADVPGLGYADRGDPEALARNLLAAARAALGGDPDLLHVHNHAIGKNVVLPQALRILAGRGVKILLQIHDFAEDGRPENYRALAVGIGRNALDAALYPVAPHIHYALLNLRDRALLIAAGSPEARTHHLPNCAGDGAALPPPEGPTLFVYPTRAIRRKNLGEFLLWSALSEPDIRWATSLAPRSASDRVHYEGWMKFATEQQLPVEFEAGIKHNWSLDDLLRAASAIVTTSVAEGFGLAFLEPWLAGRPLYGRNLPDVTMDMAEAGLELDHLYHALHVPADWVGIDRIRRAVGVGLSDLYAAYGRTVPDGALDRACHGMGAYDTLDFGRLDEAMQRDVITRVVREPDAAARLQPSSLLALPASAAMMERNRSVARGRYGPAAYADRLLAIYGQLTESEPGPLTHLAGDTILNGFLDPSRFRLLRS